MKATTLLGGVQVFQIIIQIIRSKFIAVLLGPTGIGILGLFNATLSLITNLTNFGLGTSVVKDVAAAYETENQKRLATIVIVIRRLVWITGLFGTLTMLILSYWLSQITFGTPAYTLAFVWLSMTLLFTQLSTGQLVLLQGMRKLHLMAKANLWGSALSLLLTLPLYYLCGIDGIVPGIIISSIITLTLTWHFSNRITIALIPVSKIRTIAEGKVMLTLGFMISLSGLITAGASYLVRIFIGNTGGLAEVGLYNAGFAIINSYVGLVFTAMATDYYPRLSAVANNNQKCRQTINQQAEVAILILAPIIIIFLVFIDWAVVILYSKQFIAINEMIYWAALGMLFKAASFSIAFIFLAKGNGRLYFWNELLANIYLFVLNIIGYHLDGLTGLGLSFLIAYVLYLIQVYVVSMFKYNIGLNNSTIKIFCIQFMMALCCFLSIKFFPTPYPYFLGLVFILASSGYSLKELGRRIGINHFFTKKDV